MFEPLKKHGKFFPDSNKTKLITEKIVKFIINDQPFSVVENVVSEFLTECFKTCYTLPNQQEMAGPHLYSLVNESLPKHLENAGEFSS